MDCGEESILMRPELFKFSLEKLIFVVGKSHGFLVQNQNIRYVIRVNLKGQSKIEFQYHWNLTLSLRSLRTCPRSLFKRFSFFNISSTLDI